MEQNSTNQSIIDFLAKTAIFADNEISAENMTFYHSNFISFMDGLDNEGIKMIVMECVLDIFHATGLCDLNHSTFYKLVDLSVSYSSMIMIILVTYFLDIYLYERDMKANDVGVTLNPAYAANFVYLVNSVINDQKTVMDERLRANFDIIFQDYLHGSYLDFSMGMGDYNENGVSNIQIANFWNNLWVGFSSAYQENEECISKQTLNDLFDTFLASAIYHLGLNL